LTTPDWPALLDEALGNYQPVVVMLAGSNGAGKTTFYRRYLPGTGLPFVNADEIARAIDPRLPETNSYQAMQLADVLRADLIQHRLSFCMETVLSDTHGAKLGFLEQARKVGYCIVVIFIRIASPDLSAARVSQRVLQGGHDVPASKLRERFPRTQSNAAKAMAIAHLGIVLDNSSARAPYAWRETWRNGRLIAAA
jgi:predicted ABC-type ATPase